MKLLVNIILFGSLFAQSIDNELNEQFIESLVDDLNRQRNNSVIKIVDYIGKDQFLKKYNNLFVYLLKINSAEYIL